MKLLFTAWRDLDHPDAGGSEVLVDRLAQGLHDRGHEVTLLAGGPVGRRGYDVVNAGGTFTQYARTPYLYLRRFRDVDLVIDVSNGMSAFTPMWRRRPTVCLVHHVHTEQWDMRFGPVGARLGRFLEHVLMPRVYRRSLFVAVSPSTRDSLVDLGIGADRIRIVPNGVDWPEDVAPTSPEPVFVAIGRFVPHKRFDLLLRVWPRVRPQTGGRLVIVGTGPEEDRLKSLGSDGVEWVGYVSEKDKDRLLTSAWLLVHPAMHEGWGLVIMEAAARATPTLGFRVPGVRDAVVDGRTGVLVDHEAELAEQWINLARNPARREQLGLQARQRARDYGWDHSVDLFEAAVAEHLDR